jgi:cytochrome c-type biogenesis protein
MLDSLFTALTRALESSAALALAGAFAWGILSILLSPCHLTSIPLIVGFLGGQGILTGRRALGLSALFAGGILTTIAAVGLVTGLAGRMLGDVGPWGGRIVAVFLVAVGLVLIGVLPMPFSGGGSGSLAPKRRGASAAFGLGLAFGLAVGPCTFAYMAPVLAVAFRVASERLAFAVSLVLAYALGHCSVIVAAGASTSGVQRVLHWNERSKGALWLKRACGVLVIAAGLYMLFS